MNNDAVQKLFLDIGDGMGQQIDLMFVNAPQTIALVNFVPQVSMLFGEREQITDPSRARIPPDGDGGEKQPGNDSNPLQQGRPILLEPKKGGHLRINTTGAAVKETGPLTLLPESRRGREREAFAGCERPVRRDRNRNRSAGCR